jgi:Uma2 family endonuclease
MTFAEFERLPEAQNARYELHHGELVQVPPAKWKHFVIQERMRLLIADAAGAAGHVVTQIAFKPLPDHEYWIADVAFVSKERWEQTDPDGYFQGAPDLVIEIVSPSNTAAEMLDKETTCLENGARQFWVVDEDRRQVKVSTPDGHTVTYKSGQEIPLFFGGVLSVDAIFR